MPMPAPMYTAVPSPSQLPWPLLARLRLAFPPNPKSLSSSSFSLAFLQRPYSSLLPCSRSTSASKRSRAAAVRAVRQESPYEVLRVPPSATPEDIKRAYRKLALKYHPDVNKEANAQERFMRIKHAYNTLMNSKSRFNTTSNGANYSTRYEKEANAEEEQYYGIVDFFRDLQEELRNWDADLNREEKPRSLWEELAEIGEEFVEFLEKELNVQETYFEDDSMESRKEKQQEDEAQKPPSVEDSIDEVEAALAQLKKELGL